MSTTFWIQFLGILFGLGMMYFTFIRYKRKELTSGEALLWWSGWVVLILIALLPNALDVVIAPLHFYRRLDFFVVIGFFTLLGVGFFNYSSMKKLEKKLETYVRSEALQEAEQPFRLSNQTKKPGK